MIFDLFRELNRKGLTLVIVTHNKDLAKKAEDVHTPGWNDQGLRDLFINFMSPK
jgi:ABC-type lipoprotein export system ATPase subunit